MILSTIHRAPTASLRSAGRRARRRRAAASILLPALLFAGGAVAETVDEEALGFEIAARSDRSDRGFGDSEVSLTMVLHDSAGRRSERSLRITTLEVPDESVGDRSLVVFSSPKDVEGTALLSHAKILEPDDQWLYLPALKRVKRISSRNKSGPFVGSEFAFEDFTSLELEKFAYRHVGEEPLDGLVTDVVERTPLYEDSGYTRQVAWIDRDLYQIRKVDYYDRRADLLKTLALGDYREYGSGLWRAHELVMENHQSGKRTELIYDDYRFALDLGERDFVKGVLRRVR